MKFIVYGSVSIGVSIEVEADSADLAIDQAYVDFPGLSNYCGNGGSDQLVGVNDEKVSLDAGYAEAEFAEAEPV